MDAVCYFESIVDGRDPRQGSSYCGNTSNVLVRYQSRPGIKIYSVDFDVTRYDILIRLLMELGV